MNSLKCEATPCWCFGSKATHFTKYANGKEVPVSEACAMNNLILGHPSREIPAEDSPEDLKQQIQTLTEALAAKEKETGILSGKYGNVLTPFLQNMEKELHANSGKGGREGWLSMTPEIALLEIYYHLAKLQKAAKDNDLEGVKEYSADVANMSMMLADIYGVLTIKQVKA